jgi:hypothetical protein
VLLLYTTLSAPAFAHAHPHFGSSLNQYADPWPVALGGAVAVMGIVLAVIPIRRGERWAIWASAATLVALLVTRAITDPRCAVVLDPTQHGCHTFMIAMVVGLTGLALAGFGR